MAVPLEQNWCWFDWNVSELVATTSIAATSVAVAIVAGVQIVADDSSLAIVAGAESSRGSGSGGSSRGVR